MTCSLLSCPVAMAYRWVQSWFNYIETEEEFDMSYGSLMEWLSSTSSNITPFVGEAIRNFVIQFLLPKKMYWLRAFRLTVRAFDEKSNSLVEGQNSSMKHGSMPVRPNMSLKTSAKTMLDKTLMLHAHRSVIQSKKVGKTSLWSNTNISGLLTCYAEGLVTEHMERRVTYSCAKGEYSPLIPVFNH